MSLGVRRQYRTPRAATGWTTVEILIAMLVVGVVAAFAVPMAANARDASRARHAAGFVATRFRAAKQQAIVQERFVAVVFDRTGDGWVFRICADGNRDGVRRAQIATGVDPCVEGPFIFSALFPGVAIDVDQELRGPEGEPGSPDPVRFGSSDIASFSPWGSCTAGSLYLRSTQGLQYAVRVAGVTGRTRVLKYDTGSGSWKEA